VCQNNHQRTVSPRSLYLDVGDIYLLQVLKLEFHTNNPRAEDYLEKKKKRTEFSAFEFLQQHFSMKRTTCLFGV